MEISESLLTLFSGKIEKHGDSFVVEIPERELEIGNLNADEVYRIAITPGVRETKTQPTTPDFEPTNVSEGPPVEEGEILDVEIEDMGDQGDGITRVGPGYVVIVPDTKVGDRVSVEIAEAKENVAFADVIERKERPR
jgi:predicted RNA-binding protein with TRAM domain